jgi:hypothetical protein
MTKAEYINIVNDGIKKVEQFTVTTLKKSHHKSRLYDLKKLYNELSGVNRHLFDSDYNFEFQHYKFNVEINKTKKELDKDLKYCIITIHNQLVSIKQNINEIIGLE